MSLISSTPSRSIHLGVIGHAVGLRMVTCRRRFCATSLFYRYFLIALVTLFSCASELYEL